VVALGEQQLEDRPAVLGEVRAVGRDLHVRGDGGRAGGPQNAVLGDLDDAQPAAAVDRQPLQVAQRRDVDALPAGDVEDRLALLGRRRCDRRS
jgi:hypothetical protein